MVAVRLQRFSLREAVANSKTSAEGVDAVESEWTYLTGEEGQPNRIVCRDGFEVFNIIRGAFRGDHYVSLYLSFHKIHFSVVRETW